MSILLALLASNIIYSTDIQKDCAPLKEVYGCYVESTQKIYVDNNLKGIERKSVLYHEIGHYLTKDIPDEQLQKISGGKTHHEIRENAAWDFDRYALNWKLSSKKKAYYKNLLQKNITKQHTR